MATPALKPPVKASEPSTSLSRAALLRQQEDDAYEDALVRTAQKAAQQYTREHPPKQS
jgi:hypothetical protein